LLDVVVCSVVLVALLPLLAAIALIVKLTSPGPVFFRQERAGLNGRPFRMIKFRTMTGVPRIGQTVWTAAEESRITSTGRFLRVYGLDELPQLVNIVKGDMSIIGPRPPLPAQVKGFTDAERRMGWMRPGVTGLSAVSGRYSLTYEERKKYNVEYVDRWSLGLDAAIMLRTIGVVLARRSAAESQVVSSEKAEERT